MPVQRVSRGFKDLSMSFLANPVNYDLIALKNESAIARAVRNLVLTQPGERFFNDNLGSKVSAALFENMDEITAGFIQQEIEDTINTYEPRVKLIEVIVSPDFDNNEFNVTVSYEIVGIDVPAQQITFALQPTR